MSKVYALSVGINDYSPPVGKLRGCLNDVHELTKCLASIFDKDKLCLETLTDSDATRGNIIQLFRSHLCRAKADDVVLFHYSGHGARCRAAKEFKRFYPDGWDEGLVCYDSRLSGGFDLADKELAVLLAEVARNAPHIAVLLDCCHSGSATRNADVFLQAQPRVTREVSEERPIDSYVDGYYAKLLQQGASLEIPASQHILLAACERVQLALENREHRGVFTTSLLDALAESGPDVCYADLFMRVRTTVRRYAENQTPQFETYQRFNAYSGFLGKAASGSSRSYNVYFDTTWKVECGAVHGLPSDPDKIAELALYRGETLIGYAETVQVGAQESEVNLLDVQADPQEQLKGRVTSLPVPPLVIHLDGDAQGIKVVLDCFAAADNRAYGFSFSTDKNAAGYTLLAKDNELNLYDGCRLIQCVKECSVRGVERLFLILKQIAAWERAVALQNKSTKLDKDAVAFQLVECLEDGKEKPFSDEEIVLDVTKQGDVWREITAKLRANNRTDQALHFALVYFANDFSVQVPYNERLEPTEELFELIINDSATFSLSLEEQEGDQATHILKLIASTEKIDDFLLAQEGITIGETVNFTKAVAFGKPKPQKKIYRNEWFTKTIRVTLVRRLDQVGAKDVVVVNQKVPVASKPAADRPVTRSLREVTYREQKITIKGHTSFKADISLMGVQAGSRSVAGDSDFYRALERQGLELLRFSPKTRGGAAESILELTNIQGTESLEKEPLEIEIDFGLAEEEYILPLTFDGEHILLAGEAEKDAEGRTLIHIDHIPDGIPDHRRSLLKAIKLYFFKTYLKKDDVNKLCWVEFRNDGSILRHEEDVAKKVSAAKNVLLLVHGIIGDTENIAQGLMQVRDATGTALSKKFDLVLTYDYENLSTKIEDTARKLKAQLRDVGLHENDSKRLTLLVHSMGGLVSRWFIEQEGGNKIVDHLVMCGTPNVGSPFGKIDAARSLTGVLTTWAMNCFAAFAPFGAGLLAVFGRSKKITPTLEQMNPNSEFIQKLNAGGNPGIRYTILAGDVRNYDQQNDKLMAKLVAKIGKGELFDALYHDAGHDIAVSLASIQGVPEARQPVPKKTVVDCHHLNYFVSEAGLRALEKVEW